MQDGRRVCRINFWDNKYTNYGVQSVNIPKHTKHSQTGTVDVKMYPMKFRENHCANNANDANVRFLAFDSLYS